MDAVPCTRLETMYPVAQGRSRTREPLGYERADRGVGRRRIYSPYGARFARCRQFPKMPLIWVGRVASAATRRARACGFGVRGRPGPVAPSVSAVGQTLHDVGGF